MQLHADWAVTLACGEGCPYVPAMVEDWDIEDPRNRPIGEVRRIRDEIEKRVMQLLNERIDDIRADRTAHHVRLERLLSPLIEEFGADRTPEEIRACADAILSDYIDAPVRSFVMTIASKRARDRLRREIGKSVRADASFSSP